VATVASRRPDADVILGDFPPIFLRVLSVCFGLVWGSFLNVVIYRVPRGMSVVRPASHCPGCGKPVRAWDNVPVLSWLLLRGKARCCGVAISPRYPLVEAIGGLLSLAILEVIVLRLDPFTAAPRALAIYAVDLALALALVAGAFIDVEHLIVPDSITLGGTMAGLATASFRDLPYWESLLGAAVGFVVVWLPFVVVYPWLRGRVGMGLGDAKLLMLAGAWFGWPGALLVLGAGAVQGTVVAIVLMILNRGKIAEPEAVLREREETRRELELMSPEDRAEAEKELALDPIAEEAGEGLGQQRIAFGPFLSLATLECLFFGRDVLSTYFGWTG
jgi:leader peptidase (prepilin peptidase)/N-methyltransferase